MTASVEALKRAAAAEALHLVKDGMVVGLGSGSTAELFLTALAERASQGVRVTGVPTSKRVARLAAERGIRVIDLADAPRVDLTVDGADEIERSALGLVKGRGGALVREKLVAAASNSLCIVADDSKLVTLLGERQPVPVAVLRFGWRQTAARIGQLGCSPTLRMHGNAPLTSDDGLYLLDCHFGPIVDPARLGAAIKAIPGVVEHGLFLGLASRALVASEQGVAVYEPGTVTA